MYHGDLFFSSSSGFIVFGTSFVAYVEQSRRYTLAQFYISFIKYVFNCIPHD